MLQRTPRAARLSRIAIASLGAATLAFIYFFNLGAMGVVGPDEPRYAAIGRAMAQSGDWITPRLWGVPWFEKPALLYWMTAAGFRMGLSEDLAPRVPVALMSVAFLVFYFWILRREFGARAAGFATAMLATSAGWIAFSRVGVTDLPLAAASSSAMLLTLPWIASGGVASGERGCLIPAAAMLGLAVLAKGLVPLALALPVLWMGRNRLRDLFEPKPVLAFALIAVPWYALCAFRNGPAFLETFFWEHHVQRFTSNTLHHAQPIWYYAPVIAAALFPWTPVLALLFRRDPYRDPRLLFLLLWATFGFLFFSAATNKLPGYLLPILPAVFALGGAALAKARSAGPFLLASALLLAVTPLVAFLLPPVLARGSLAAGLLDQGPWEQFSAVAATMILVGLALWNLDRIGARNAAFASLAALATVSIFYLETFTIPAIDRDASARSLWREMQLLNRTACVRDINKSWRYGLDYYAAGPLPDCVGSDAAVAVLPGVGRPQIRENSKR